MFDSNYGEEPLIIQIVPYFIGTVIVLMTVFFIFIIFKGLREWNKNNHSPKLLVPASIISKRTNVSRHQHNDHHHSSTRYYVTFEFETGDRSEFQVTGQKYGLLAENDFGDLTFQGTRFLDFQRKI